LNAIPPSIATQNNPATSDAENAIPTIVGTRPTPAGGWPTLLALIVM
jgi:hypothetical protein